MSRVSGTNDLPILLRDRDFSDCSFQAIDKIAPTRQSSPHRLNRPFPSCMSTCRGCGPQHFRQTSLANDRTLTECVKQLLYPAGKITDTKFLTTRDAVQRPP